MTATKRTANTIASGTVAPLSWSTSPEAESAAEAAVGGGGGTVTVTGVLLGGRVAPAPTDGGAVGIGVVGEGVG